MANLYARSLGYSLCGNNMQEQSWPKNSCKTLKDWNKLFSCSDIILLKAGSALTKNNHLKKGTQKRRSFEENQLTSFAKDDSTITSECSGISTSSRKFWWGSILKPELSVAWLLLLSWCWVIVRGKLCWSIQGFWDRSCWVLLVL